jgi:hypothetical protein
LVSLGFVKPAVVLPEPCHMVVILAELLAERPWKTVRAVNRFRIGVMVSEDGEHRTLDI